MTTPANMRWKLPDRHEGGMMLSFDVAPAATDEER
jgi:hypothetical protein